ncbi:MAG: hypothetical protein KKB51_25105 [Candidatus Riflebacteria bacterium]|nr:hypothetical protein [Candidatus Riflebacteria bacterium]
MSPVASLLTGHFAGKLIDRIATSFRLNVIERWSKHRGQQFFDQFCHEVELELAGESSDKLESLLSKMLEDEHTTELLFDAYRRVSLSRSKTIGPRVIGVLSARLAIQKRELTDVEETILDAAEQLYDDELIKFALFCNEHQQRAANEKDKDVTIGDDGFLRIKWAGEQIDSNWDHEFNLSLQSLDLNDCYGSWAMKMQSLGIIRTDVTEEKRTYKEDSERHIDQDGSVREISWWTFTSDKYFDFAEIINRVKPKQELSKTNT